MIKNIDLPKAQPTQPWVFKLYVCGEGPRSVNAYYNLKKVCDARLNGQYRIFVVDLIKNPHEAFNHNIMACPTVIKESPNPQKTVIGDLSKTEAVLAKLEFPIEPLAPDLSKRARSVSLTDAQSFIKNIQVN
jgi:circadian clock protein KaiB